MPGQKTGDISSDPPSKTMFSLLLCRHPYVRPIAAAADVFLACVIYSLRLSSVTGRAVSVHHKAESAI